ncbi:MAG: AAA family ATPase, partial [Cyanobacteria bacterium]|nr:AAA family ATPase [Cyanobacteriota bacterium]
DGEWHLGHSDVERPAAGAQAEGTYQEVVLRFNQCQSVLPGSPHPDTGKRYRWLNYNDGQVAMAPEWVLEVLRSVRKPVQWLSDADQKALDEELGETAIPSRQIRGWFFKEEVQDKLRPRLADLIFNHPVFDKYGWRERDGSKPQMMSGCPWHGGRSGTSFQYSVESGCWDCKACGIGGDVLDFVHKARSNNMHATRPQGPDLEMYVGELAAALGYQYPEDARVQVQKEAPLVRMSSVEFFEELGRIYDTERNPSVRSDRMLMLAMETGRRMSGKECESALGEYRYKEAADRQNSTGRWFDEVEDQEFIIPNLLVRPGQVILHAAGGVGKTSACLGLAKAVLSGSSMRVRGIDVDVVQGPVLWIQSDQTLSKLKRDLADNGIDPEDPNFHVIRGFQINHIAEFTELVRKFKPVLVVVDSIGSCSSRMQVSEIEKAFATPLYHYNEANGSPAADGFPACAIIWIHHDNANGEVRGNRYLINAVDEQWHLRKLKDEERDQLRERGENPSATRMIQIKKSRAGREGDLLKVIRDADFAYSVEDFTPTVRREDEGQGDADPNTLVLDIVKRASKAQEEVGETRVGCTREQVWSELLGQLRGAQGDRARVPSQKTVGRWLDRWVEDGLLEKKKVGTEKSPPVLRYKTACARALPSIWCPLTEATPNLFQRNGSGSDNGSDTSELVRTEAGLMRDDLDGEGISPEHEPVEAHIGSDTSDFALSENPVTEGDLGGDGTRDIGTDTTCARAGEGDRPVLGQYIPAAGEWDSAFGPDQPDPDSRLG